MGEVKKIVHSSIGREIIRFSGLLAVILIFVAVSYTHLDVYKRQGNTCMMRRSSESMMIHRLKDFGNWQMPCTSMVPNCPYS